VPDCQQHVCYFRPGTGNGVWLTTADMQRRLACKRGRRMLAWVPKDKDDGTCQCEQCVFERTKVAWNDCRKCEGPKSSLWADTPPTSAGNSPRTSSSEWHPSSSSEAELPPASRRAGVPRHCPHLQGEAHCSQHDRWELRHVLSNGDVKQLYQIWENHHDDLSHPWYQEKPRFSDKEFTRFRRIALKVVKAMSEAIGEPLVLDQATVSSTNRIGHPPHSDNMQFDSVWWAGRQIKQRDELVATRGGAEVLWKDAKTVYRNYSATLALTEPWEYGGGDLQFFRKWGDTGPCQKYRLGRGSGVAFCGCQRNIHAVTGVKWGFRLVLLVWTRSPDVPLPPPQGHVCYFRPGTGMSVWLTGKDLEQYPLQQRARGRACRPVACRDTDMMPVPPGVEDEAEHEEDDEDFAADDAELEHCLGVSTLGDANPASECPCELGTCEDAD